MDGEPMRSGTRRKTPRGEGRRGSRRVPDPAVHAQAVSPEPSQGETGAVVVDTAGLPALDDLSALLAEATTVQEQLSISDQEVTASVAQYDALQQKKGLVERIKDHLVGRSEKMGATAATESQRLGNADAWTSADIENFVKDGIVNQQYADALQLFNQKIAALSTDEQFKKSQKGVEIIGRMRVARAQIVEGVQKRLELRQQKAGVRIQRVQDSAVEHHAERVAKLDQEMNKITENPLVADRLAQRDRVAAEAAEVARKAVEDRARAQAEQLKRQAEQQRAIEIRRVVDALKFFEERFNQKLARINEIVGSQVSAQLLKSMQEKEKATKDKQLEPTRKALIEAVSIADKKTRLESPADIAPWMRDGKDYGTALQFLSGSVAKKIVDGVPDEKLRDVLKSRIKQVNALADMFNYLLNGESKQGQSPFFKAFDARNAEAQAKTLKSKPAVGDAKAGAGAAKQEIRNAAEVAIEAQRALDVSITDIEKNGGFAVEVAGFKGAVLVKEERSKKGNVILLIKRIAGNIPGIRIGQSSDLRGSSFPQWLQTELGIHPPISIKSQDRYEQAKGASTVATPAVAVEQPPKPPAEPVA